MADTSDDGYQNAKFRNIKCKFYDLVYLNNYYLSHFIIDDDNNEILNLLRNKQTTMTWKTKNLVQRTLVSQRIYDHQYDITIQWLTSTTCIVQTWKLHTSFFKCTDDNKEQHQSKKRVHGKLNGKEKQ